MLPALGVIGTALAPVIAWLIRAAIVKTIIAFGVSLVTYVGYTYALNELKAATVDAVNQMPHEALQLFLISGMGQGMGYIFGALSFNSTMKAVNRIAFGQSS